MKKLIAVVMMSLSVGCQFHHAENKRSQILSMLKETQQAAVFYLDNGMEVILVENHANPMIAAVTVVKAGSRNEDAANNGSAHFLEHLLFNGTRARTQKQIYDEMEFYGGYHNAHTGPDYTNYIMLMPKEYIAQGMDIQADMLFNSTLPDDKFEKERGIVIEEIGKDADRPKHQANDHFLRVFYAGTPYGRPVLGTVSTISHLKRERVWEYYGLWYVPNNMSLMVIGDFSTPEMLELVKKKYGKSPAGQMPERQAIKLNSPERPRIVKATGAGKFPRNRQYLTIGYLMPAPVSDEFQSVELFTDFLGGGENSVLKALFKEEQNKDLVVDIGANIEVNSDFSVLQVSAELPVNVDVEHVVELIQRAVREVPQGPVKASEVHSALTVRATRELYLLESLHYYGMLKSGYLAAGGYAFLRDYLDGLMRVTPQSLQRVAQYLSAQTPVVALLSPQPEKLAGEATSRSPNQYLMTRLENGLTVAIKENRDSRVMGVHVLAKERSLSEGKEKRGLTEVLQRMLSQGGTIEHPEKALREAFDSMGAELKLHDDPQVPFDDYYNSPRFAYMRLKLVDTFLEQGLELLAEMVKRPSLSEEAFREAKREVVALSENEALSAGRIAERVLYDHLFKTNPGFGWLLGRKEEIEKIHPEDVKLFHQRFYSPSNLVLAVSGNISRDKVLAAIRKNFDGAWGEAGWAPPVSKLEMQAPDGLIREKVGKQQSHISVASMCHVGEEDRPVLHVVEGILNDRLAFALRERQGLAYSIGVSFTKYGGAQWYRVSMATRAENVERAVQGIRDELGLMGGAKFEEKEVQKTINGLLGRRGMRRLDRVNQAYYMSMKGVWFCC